MNPKIIDDIIKNEESGIELAKKYNATPSYISKIKKGISQLKYLPVVIDGKVVCSLCKERKTLVSHHDHNTGEMIALVCDGCNKRLGNSSTINGLEINTKKDSTNEYVGMCQYQRIVGMEMPLDFPLSGKDVKEIIKNLWVFPLAINDQEKYTQWVEFNPKLAADLDSLISWSQKQRDEK